MPPSNGLVNNEGIARIAAGALDPSLVDVAREVFETNFYGRVLLSRAFALVPARDGAARVFGVGVEELLADEFTRSVKRILGDERPLYLHLPGTD